MYEVYCKPSFVNTLSKVDAELRQEIYEKIELLRHKNNHKKLKVHKLHGKLSKYWSFSVNYRVRIIFIFKSNNVISLMDIGDHDVYR